MNAYAYGLVLACGLIALLYGLITVRSILALSTGNEKMREIAGAIQMALALTSTASTRSSP